MIKAIICDWNRTLFEDRYEDIFFKGLFKEIVFRPETLCNIFKLVKLWTAKRQCEHIYKGGGINKEDSGGKIELIVDIMNGKVIKRLPVSVLEKYTEKYANHACKRLDERLLRPLKELHNGSKVILGIISSGYRTGIKKTLAKKGYYFDFIEANDFEEDEGRIRCFGLKIYRDKKALLRKALSDRKLDKQVVAYIGDDWQDIECFKEVGFPIVSFLAEKSFKDTCRKELNAFVPVEEEECRNYIFNNL